MPHRPFAEDTAHHTYDTTAVTRYWRVLSQITRANPPTRCSSPRRRLGPTSSLDTPPPAGRRLSRELFLFCKRPISTFSASVNRQPNSGGRVWRMAVAAMPRTYW
ncbi:MAG: hypothetical protein ACRDS0_16805 [Pseudonocardiaceae bacterium]